MDYLISGETYLTLLDCMWFTKGIVEDDQKDIDFEIAQEAQQLMARIAAAEKELGLEEERQGE